MLEKGFEEKVRSKRLDLCGRKKAYLVITIPKIGIYLSTEMDLVHNHLELDGPIPQVLVKSTTLIHQHKLINKCGNFKLTLL
ncbi:MAG TPA: hypothetical protein DCE41_31665 [Cytophagales bacterium]|nr:hypothetical protein [Cytophagales bacterium]HAA23204.1 hypothetical protein [Cytophagales bacterium]HAP64815.1 hypothetical protein [Cytophagales bacterium]